VRFSEEQAVRYIDSPGVYVTSDVYDIPITFIIDDFKLSLSQIDTSWTDTFPDENFLIGILYDLNLTGHEPISSSMDIISNLQFLSVCGYEVKDITGLEIFTGLENLWITDNQLTTLDLSGFTMRRIYAQNNLLTGTLDLSEFYALVEIDVSGNDLEVLNLYGLRYIETLDVSGNRLTELDVSRKTYLEVLRCGGNMLTEIVLNPEAPIRIIDVSNNQLTRFDVNGNDLSELIEFNAENNPAVFNVT